MHALLKKNPVYSGQKLTRNLNATRQILTSTSRNRVSDQRCWSSLECHSNVFRMASNRLYVPAIEQVQHRSYCRSWSVLCTASQLFRLWCSVGETISPAVDRFVLTNQKFLCFDRQSCTDYIEIGRASVE